MRNSTLGKSRSPSTSFVLKFAAVTSAMLSLSVIFEIAHYLFAVLAAPMTGFVSGAFFSSLLVLVIRFMSRKLGGRAIQYRPYFIAVYVPISVLFSLQMQGFFYLDFREPFIYQFAAFIMFGHSMLFAAVTTPMVKKFIRREISPATSGEIFQA